MTDLSALVLIFATILNPASSAPEPARQQPDEQPPGNLIRSFAQPDSGLDTQTREKIESLEQAMRSGDGADVAAADLAGIAVKLFDQKNPSSPLSREASRIARNLFLGSSPNGPRKQVFAIYRAGYPYEYVRHIQEITVIVPNVTCHGRLVDSFRSNIALPSEWVWDVSIRNSFRTDVTEAAAADGELMIGSDAYVTFTVNRSTHIDELKQALVDSRAYDMKHWKVLVAQPLLP